MTVRVLLFGGLRGLFPSDELLRVLPGASTIEDLLDILEAESRGQSGFREGLGCAVNEAWSSPDAPLKDGDVVALLPPVSGG